MGFPGFDDQTKVAQMHFASELPLSKVRDLLNTQKMSIQQVPGEPQLFDFFLACR